MVITVLNVAEKPSVAKGISNILSRGRPAQSRTHSKYNPVTKFPATVQGQQCDMLVTSVLGHVMEMDFRERMGDWRATPFEKLFDAPVKKSVAEKMKPLERNLKEYARKSQWLVLWLDCDREGENIAYEVIELCTSVNRRLRILRAHFSAVTEADIYRAINTLTPPDERLSLAADARSELDLRTGAIFTRWQTVFLQDHCPPLMRGIKRHEQDRPILSYGSCQFPTLGFVVDRHFYIQNFVEEQFWKIDVSYKKDDARVDFLWKRGRLFDHAACAILCEDCVEEGRAIVVNASGQRKTKWKPIPLNTIALQKLAGRHLRFSAHRTLEFAEQLYNAGYISYPRTETTVFGPGTDFRILVANQQQSAKWGAYAQGLMNGKFEMPRAGKEDDKSHPPIHPVQFVGHTGGIITDAHLRLYEMIVRHFLACCSRDAIGQQSRVDIEIGTERFFSTGLMVQEKNYLEVYPYDRWVDRAMPSFVQGEQFVPTSINLTEDRTRAPPHLSEPELIELMDKNGIGTDATIAQHIEKILSRGYTIKEDNRFVPTALGLALVSAYDEIELNLTSPKSRARLEQELTRICRGERTKGDVLEEALAEYRQVFTALRLRERTFLKTVETVFFAQQALANAGGPAGGPRGGGGGRRGDRGGGRGGRN